MNTLINDTTYRKLYVSVSHIFNYLHEIITDYFFYSQAVIPKGCSSMMNGTCKISILYVKINWETVQCLHMRYKYTISHWIGGECPVGKKLNLACRTKSTSDHIFVFKLKFFSFKVCCEHEDSLDRIQYSYSKEYPFRVPQNSELNVVFISERTLGLFRLLFLVDLVLRTRSQWRPYGPWAANVVVNCFVVYREYQMKVYQMG